MNGFQESPMSEDVPVVNPIISIGLKKCRKCGKIKVVSEFYAKKKYGAWSPCKECTLAKQKIKAKDHVVEKAIYDKAYVAANKERLKARAKEYYIANRDEILARQRVKGRIYRETHKEKCKEYSRQYLQTPRGRAFILNQTMKRRALASGGDVTGPQLRELLEKAKTCYWCGTRLTNKTGKHVDHYMPLSKMGKHSLDNLVISCAYCNLTKNAKDPYKFAEGKGRLL